MSPIRNLEDLDCLCRHRHVILLNSTNKFANLGIFMSADTLIACCKRYFKTTDILVVLARCTLIREPEVKNENPRNRPKRA